MSIHNDYRKHGTEEQRQEWLQELKDEYRRQEAYDARCDDLEEAENERNKMDG